MVIGSFPALLPTRPAYRKGEAESPAMESLVPGDYRQTEEDLSLFPQPVLDMLSRYGTRVAVLAEGQTLADTPGLRTMDEHEVTSVTLMTNEIVSKALEKGFAQGVDSLEKLETLADATTRELRAEGIDNYLALALNPFHLDDLAASRGIPQENLQDWKSTFSHLNSNLTTLSSDEVSPKFGIVVLPHTYHNGQAVPEMRLKNARETTSEFVKGSLGINRSDERMVLLHQDYVMTPTPELGNYALAVHEVGHALDHALEHLHNFPGFGEQHRQTVDALYQADLAKIAVGRPAEEVFTSDRADDDVREYFAEAVEAYLTPENHNGHDTFRSGNSTEGLAQKNPELFSYIDKVMTTDFPSTALPGRPQRSYAPPGFPDPDLEVIRIS